MMTIGLEHHRKENLRQNIGHPMCILTIQRGLHFSLIFELEGGVFKIYIYM